MVTFRRLKDLVRTEASADAEGGHDWYGPRRVSALAEESIEIFV